VAAPHGVAVFEVAVFEVAVFPAAAFGVDVFAMSSNLARNLSRVGNRSVTKL
jgi:galactitol-specific phosphotransferase system IIB component